MAVANELTMDARTRAELKRADPWEVRGAYAWVERLRALDSLKDVDQSRLMALAPLIAEVREDTGTTLGSGLRKAGVSEARVRRLLASESGEDIRAQLARMVRVMGRSAGVVDLVATAIYWGDRKRRQIAQEYFGATGEVEDA